MRSMWLRTAALAAALYGVAAAAHAQVAGSDALRHDVEAARTYLATAGEDGFSGVVLVADGDDVVIEEAFGWADADLGVPMRTEHRLRIGSLTKPITASAVLVAVKRGLLSLDDRACERLPACLAAWEPVRVRHLLSHSSGIPDHFGDLEAVPVEATLAELERLVRGLPGDEALATPPGEAYAYSNFNYVLLGAMLERAAGKPWETVLRELVFEPLGLESMAYDDVHAVMHGRVRGYDRDEAGSLRNIDYDDHAAYAAGGLLSTASDLFRWSRGVLSAKLYGADLLAESLTPNEGDYGFGWQVRRFFDRPVYNHTGGIDGFSSHLAHYPEDGLTIVVLSNVESDAAILRACDIAARAFSWFGPEESLDDLTPRQRCGLER